MSDFNFDPFKDEDLEATAKSLLGSSFRPGNAAYLAQLSEQLEAYERMLEEGGTAKWFIPGSPYGIENLPAHRMFFNSGATYRERIFMASNRTGKSIAGAYETACHLTGDYPFWWQGKVFDKPIKAWALGSDARSTRDTVQKELLGPVGAWGTGMIPREAIGRSWALAGVPQGVDIIEIRHKSGGWSTIKFKNYEQDVKSFYGEAVDLIWYDEECPDGLYNEGLIRTMTTGGIVYVTYTPLKGLTSFTTRFCRAADWLRGNQPLMVRSDEEEEKNAEEDERFRTFATSKAVITAGWDDAAWLSEEAKQQMLNDTPPHLREARSKGIPAMGSGNVYPIPVEDIICEPFEIPAFWRRMYGFDVGWNKTAVVWAALDPNTDTLYFYDEHYRGQAEPVIHSAAIQARGRWIPGAIDPASRGRSQTDGQKLFRMYRELGLNITPANNEVESGIQNLWQRLSTGKLKVFKTMTNWQKEYMLYRRDLHGRVIKEDDHLMDASRYVVNNMNRMRTPPTASTTGAAHATRNYGI